MYRQVSFMIKTTTSRPNRKSIIAIWNQNDSV